jgi:PEGA domain
MIVVASGTTAVAQRRPAQIRSQASAPAPAPPSTGSPFRNAATFRHRPFVRPGLPLRRLTLPVFPVFWGWGTLPFYVDSLSTPLADGPTGGVQLDVQPWRASVFVDGVYAGRVEDFKGYYNHLEVVAGPHQITVVEPGFLPLVFDIMVVPGRTTTFRGTLNTPLN